MVGGSFPLITQPSPVATQCNTLESRAHLTLNQTHWMHAGTGGATYPTVFTQALCLLVPVFQAE
jgi:hypothetical protein